jgi:hypothetical protein
MCAKQQELSELSSLAPKRAGKQPSAARSDGKKWWKKGLCSIFERRQFSFMNQWLWASSIRLRTIFSTKNVRKCTTRWKELSQPCCHIFGRERFPEQNQTLGIVRKALLTILSTITVRNVGKLRVWTEQKTLPYF